MNNNRMQNFLPGIKVMTVIGAAIALSLFVVGAFWYQDWQYALPTPRPPHLVQPAFGATPGLPPTIRNAIGAQTQPLLLHFYNPDCPCSRFNVDQIRYLVRRYGSQVRFLTVVEADPGPDVEAEVRGVELKTPFIVDTGGRIARTYGVYSTPQAVLLDRTGRIYYRGNYNISRYCTNGETSFAQIALEALLAGKPLPKLPPSATLAYGCRAPAFAHSSRP